MPTRNLEFDVEEAEEGERLDRILVRRVPELGRKGAARLFQEGAVRLDGRRVVKSVQPARGAHVSLLLPEPTIAVARETPLRVLLERPDLVVVDKPAGQPSAVIRDSDQDTLAGALLARYPEMASVGFGPREPGIIHRLDTNTSGVLVAARTQEAFRALRSALKAGLLVKRYLAVVLASALDDDAGVITDWIGPHPKSRKKVAVFPAQSPGARKARSEYRVLDRPGPFALVEVTAQRAYRHQVRAHLAARGAPIAGDALYGGAEIELGGRHALHASSVGSTAPDLAPFEVEAELPAELRALLTARS